MAISVLLRDKPLTIYYTVKRQRNKWSTGEFERSTAISLQDTLPQFTALNAHYTLNDCTIESYWNSVVLVVRLHTSPIDAITYFK